MCIRDRYIAAASIVIASRMQGIPIPIVHMLRTLNDLKYNSSFNGFKRYLAFISSLTGKKYIVKPENFVYFVCSRLPLDGVGDKLHLEAVKLLRSNSLPRKRPLVLAGAAVYIAAKRLGIKLTQKQVAEAAGVHYDTIKKAVIAWPG